MNLRWHFPNARRPEEEKSVCQVVRKRRKSANWSKPTQHARRKGREHEKFHPKTKPGYLQKKQKTRDESYWYKVKEKGFLKTAKKKGGDLGGREKKTAVPYYKADGERECPGGKKPDKGDRGNNDLKIIQRDRLKRNKHKVEV